MFRVFRIYWRWWVLPMVSVWVIAVALYIYVEWWPPGWPWPEP